MRSSEEKDISSELPESDVCERYHLLLSWLAELCIRLQQHKAQSHYPLAGQVILYDTDTVIQLGNCRQHSLLNQLGN